MASALSIGLSGLRAAQFQLDVAAHNVANASNPLFRRQLASTQTAAGGGVDTQLSTAPTPGDDLAADLLSQRQALQAFRANLRTVLASDAILGTLLDTQA